MTTDNIRESDVLCAIQMNDLDDACFYIQRIAGIDDGGVASLIFSDVNFDWSSADPLAREEKMRAYIAAEKRLSDAPRS